LFYCSPVLQGNKEKRQKKKKPPLLRPAFLSPWAAGRVTGEKEGTYPPPPPAVGRPTEKKKGTVRYLSLLVCAGEKKGPIASTGRAEPPFLANGSETKVKGKRGKPSMGIC